MDGHAASFEEAKTQFKTNLFDLEGPDPKEDKMPTPRRRRSPKPGRRRALELLASCPDREQDGDVERQKQGAGEGHRAVLMASHTANAIADVMTPTPATWSLSQ
jgi:hypothetical protein